MPLYGSGDVIKDNRISYNSRSAAKEVILIVSVEKCIENKAIIKMYTFSVGTLFHKNFSVQLLLKPSV